MSLSETKDFEQSNTIIINDNKIIWDISNNRNRIIFSEYFLIANQVARLHIKKNDSDLYSESHKVIIDIFDSSNYKITLTLKTEDAISTRNCVRIPHMYTSFDIRDIGKGDVLMLSFTFEKFDNLDTGYSEFLNDGKFSDIKIEVDDQVFNCHKIILAKKSKYFEKLNPDTLIIKECSSLIFWLLVKFIYTGIVNFSASGTYITKMINDEVLVQLYLASKHFGIKDLEDIIVQMYEKRINNDNIVNRYINTKSVLNLQQLHKFTREFIRTMPRSVRSTELISKCLNIPLDEIELFINNGWFRIY